MITHMFILDFRRSLPTVCIGLIAVMIAFGLKYHYSRATSDDLGWILGPTANLVELCAGIQFEKEAHTGYINREHRIIIAPGCAGVNFMIIAFCMTLFSRIHGLRGIGEGAAWVGISLAAAWGLAVAVNAVRILVSIHLFDADIYGGGFTPEKGHHMVGTGIYVICLYFFYLFINTDLGGRKLMKKTLPGIRLAGATLVPLCWYVLVIVGIPVLNGAFSENGIRFVDHSRIVISIGVVVFCSVFLIQWLRFRRVLMQAGQEKGCQCNENQNSDCG